MVAVKPPTGEEGQEEMPSLGFSAGTKGKGPNGPGVHRVVYLLILVDILPEFKRALLVKVHLLPGDQRAQVHPVNWIAAGVETIQPKHTCVT